MDKNVIILIGYSRHSDDEISLDTLRAIAFMTGNGDYPGPPVSMSDLQILLNSFTKAHALASDGGKKLTSIKNEERVLLVDALVANGIYVQNNCGNIRSKAIGSGYYLGSTNTTKVGPLKKITLITFSDGLNAGQTIIKAGKPKNALSMIWMFTQDVIEPRVWTKETSSRGKFTAKKLIIGKPLTAKAAGQGADDEIVWSEEFTFPTVR
jgi:hypothetical protein